MSLRVLAFCSMKCFLFEPEALALQLVKAFILWTAGFAAAVAEPESFKSWNVAIVLLPVLPSLQNERLPLACCKDRSLPDRLPKHLTGCAAA